ncbi:MAG: hypothetical protein ACYC5T_02795 [Thiobacillus sp.]
MGEKEFEQKVLAKAVERAWHEEEHAAAELRVATPGGRFQVRWDEGGSATALGQLAFFAEFLEVSGLFARWMDSCPMAYTSPNAPAVVDVLGPWLLSILDGQRRYAHVAGLRGDEVAPQILGMNKIVSQDARVAMQRVERRLEGIEARAVEKKCRAAAGDTACGCVSRARPAWRAPARSSSSRTSRASSSS